MRLDLAKFSSDPESRFTTSICSIVLTVAWLFDQSQQILKWNEPIISQSKNISPECQQREIIHPMPAMQMHVSQAQENLQLVPSIRKCATGAKLGSLGLCPVTPPYHTLSLLCNLFAICCCCFFCIFCWVLSPFNKKNCFWLSRGTKYMKLNGGRKCYRQTVKY